LLLLSGLLALGALAGCGSPSSDRCGDGRVTANEACDDGNTTGADGCEADCTLTPAPATCGNGTVDEGEQCDDGNATGGDGCEPNCFPTPGGTDGGGGGGGTGGGSGGGTGPATCGNGTREGAELCDDGNTTAGDGCESSCRFSAPAPHCGDGVKGASEACDDGNATSGDGCEVDCTVSVPAGGNCGDGVRKGEELCDDGNTTPGDGCENDCTPTSPLAIQCPAASAQVGAEGCAVVPGSGATLIVGTVLLPGRVLEGGQVLVDGSGNLACVGCDCSASAGAATATALLCGKNVVSPGLINGHDHITFPAAPYVAPSTSGAPERYEHRHDWRKGGAAHDGHTMVSAGGTGGADQVRWNELRQVLAGTTSISGSGGAGGLLRNLDKADTGATASRIGLGAGSVASNYDTFPLGDSSGTELVGTCSYGSKPTSGDVPATAAYLPHIAEGIEASARNEFLCLSGQASGAVNIFTPRTAMIHGVGLKPADVRFVAAAGSSLVWSPRSNVALYGDTAQATVYARAGVNVSLGTDWVRSGSMNLLRELACVDYLNQSFMGRHFSDETLWRMVTVNAARAQVVESRAGVLAAGKVADLAIFRRGTQANPYRAVVVAGAADVLLTLRGGKALFGAPPLAEALGATGCEPLDVCGSARAVCLGGGELPAGATFASLSAANANTYPLFFCAPPSDEPTCTPLRGAPWLFSGSNPYTGISTADDLDGDGISNAQDNCPQLFNPKRPLDNGAQGDADGDGTGDVCDVCPTTAGSSQCAAPAPGDTDGDGTADAQDNCPFDANGSQADADADGKGDACDACPTQANPGTASCPPTPGTPVSIYDVKSPASTVLNTKVRLQNVLVTAASNSGFFVQVKDGDPGYAGADHSGAYVYYPAPTGAPTPRTDVQPGDRVDILQATPVNYFGQVQLTSVPAGTVTVLSSGESLPAFTSVTVEEVATGGARAAQLEGVLVQLPAGVTVVDEAPAPGAGDTTPTHEFTVAATSGGTQLRVNDFLYRVGAKQNDTFSLLRGVLQYRNGNSKLEPRGPSDVQLPPKLASVGPTGQFLLAGAQAAFTFPQVLRVTLTSAQPTDTVVGVSSSNPSVLDVFSPQVTLQAGQVSTTVALNALAAGTADVRATLGADTLSVPVRVLDGSEVPSTVAFSAASYSVPPAGSVQLTVTLDIPAPSSGTVVALSVQGALGTVPASVTVPYGLLSASFTFSAAAGTGGAETVAATLGSSTATATVNVVSANTANHVVISELQLAGPGGAGDEFVELYNPTQAPVDLSGWVLQYRSAAGTSYSLLHTFAAGTTLPPRSYLLVTSNGYTGATAKDAAWGNTGISGTGGHLRLGAPGLPTTKAADAQAVDRVGWGTADGPEGTAAPAPGSSSTLERKAFPTSDAASMSTGGPDADEGNGVDTDDNAADFVVRPAPGPQNLASPAEP
jgi:cysteine-rich repeat protein